MRFFAFLVLPVAMGFFVVGCQSKDNASGDVALEQSNPGAAVIAKLDAFVIPVVDFENSSAEEAIDFLCQRCKEVDPEKEPSMRGISFIAEFA